VFLLMVTLASAARQSLRHQVRRHPRLASRGQGCRVVRAAARECRTVCLRRRECPVVCLRPLRVRAGGSSPSGANRSPWRESTRTSFGAAGGTRPRGGLGTRADERRCNLLPAGGALCVRFRECRSRCATRRRELRCGGITKSSTVFLCSAAGVRAYLLDEEMGRRSPADRTDAKY
jgi:hypothetical protein